MISSKQAQAKYGDPTPAMEHKWMTLWDVPQSINDALPVIPNKIYCNKDIIAPLEQAFNNLIARGCAKELKTWDGCFNIRNKRGLSSMSLHSWGIAVDVNAAWNGLGKEPTMSAKFVKCFTDAGFDWGGTWSRKDGMHFQLSKI